MRTRRLRADADPKHSDNLRGDAGLNLSSIENSPFPHDQLPVTPKAKVPLQMPFFPFPPRNHRVGWNYENLPTVLHTPTIFKNPPNTSTAGAKNQPSLQAPAPKHVRSRSSPTSLPPYQPFFDSSTLAAAWLRPLSAWGISHTRDRTFGIHANSHS